MRRGAPPHFLDGGRQCGSQEQPAIVSLDLRALDVERARSHPLAPATSTEGDVATCVPQYPADVGAVGQRESDPSLDLPSALDDSEQWAGCALRWGNCGALDRLERYQRTGGRLVFPSERPQPSRLPHMTRSGIYDLAGRGGVRRAGAVPSRDALIPAVGRVRDPDLGGVIATRVSPSPSVEVIGPLTMCLLAHRVGIRGGSVGTAAARRQNGQSQTSRPSREASHRQDVAGNKRATVRCLPERAHEAKGRMTGERQGLGLSGVATLLLIELLEALCYPLISGALEGAPPLTFAAMRAAIASLALAAYALATRRPWPRGARVWWLIALTGACSTALGFAGMFLGGALVSPGLASVVTNATPFVAGVLAWRLLGEQLGARRVIALVVGFVGVALVSEPSIAGGSVSGIAWVVGAACGLAVGNVAQRAMGEDVDPIAATSCQLGLGASVLVVAAVATERSSRIAWSATFAISLATLALLGTGLSAVLWFRMLARHPINRLNPFTFLSALFALAIGAVLFDEWMVPTQWVGLAGIVAAGAVASGDREGA